MALKPKKKALMVPSVFLDKKTGRFVCDYQEFDSEGKIKDRRKGFRHLLIKEGKEGSLEEQEAAAEQFKQSLLRSYEKEHNLSRAERNQKILSAKQLNDAKAAYAILEKLPKKDQSLIEAAKCFVADYKPIDQTPKLADCFRIFLANYDSKDPKCQYSVTTVRTMHAKLGPFKKYMLGLNPEIKIGEVTERHVIEFIKSRDVACGTRKKYLDYIKQFFQRFSSPKDRHRFIDVNPASGAGHYFRYTEPHVLKAAGKKTVRIIRVLQWNEVKRALGIAYEERQHGILGFAVLAILAGMRPSEIYDLAKKPDIWSRYIKLDEGVLNVDGFGKQSDQRTIDLEPVAVDWLRLIHEKGWPICYNYKPSDRNIRYANFRALTLLPEGEGDHYVALRRRLSAKKEISDQDRQFLKSRQHHLEGDSIDIFRHTYGTNLFYKSKKNVKYVTGQMGNSDKVYYRHYKGKLDHPEDHKNFFKLGPSVVLT